YIPCAILTSIPSVVNSDKMLPTNSVWYSGKSDRNRMHSSGIASMRCLRVIPSIEYSLVIHL
ncbi:MAG: hypothetical protein UH077_01140, partial [Bacteroidales bacterium]|nr:hypothetical protein [Bacteroidales bacterium]